MSDVQEAKETEDTPETLVLAWWRDLENRRGERAELRRAHSLNEVIFTAAFQRLWQRLRGTNWHSADGVALVAGVLAHVRVHDPKEHFAAQLARPHHGDKPRYSGLRFRRLLQYRERTELLEPLVRALGLIDRHANIVNLADSLYWWGDRVRRDWAFDYYGKNPKAD